MADAVNEPTQAAPADEPALAHPRPTPNVPRHRFGVAYLALAGIVGVAVGLFVVLVARGSKDSGPAWSTWKPRESTFVHRLNEISKFVSNGYALPNGQQLAVIFSTPPEVQGQGQPVPLRAIAVSSGLPGETSQDASFYDAANSWAYVFRGLGDKGVLPGKPSIGRGDLVRREALELSLYTFKYQSGVDSIVTYLPPAKGSAASTAIFLRRQDVAKALKDPLAATLTPTGTGLRPGEMPGRDLQNVRLYTNDRVYQYRFQQLQDGTPVLVLMPPHLSGSEATRAALARAKARLDRLDFYARPVRIDRVRVVVWPRLFALPWFRRFDGYAAWNLIALRQAVEGAGDDLVTHELCHVWQMQHRPLRMPLSYLRGYARNPYELEARRAVEATPDS